jgi:hypothetical protein
LFSDCDELFPSLTAVLGDWPFHRLEHIGPRETAQTISVTRDAAGYRIASPWLAPALVEGSKVGAVFSVTAELARAFAEEKPERLCLHCAAIEAAGRLIIFPNTEETGKSTLAVKLASYGFRIFADDVLPIGETGPEGRSLGIAPRLRLPLPSTADTVFREFVEAHRGPHDNEFAYLTLPSNLLAPYGAAAPIGAFVLLDRRTSAAAQLVPVLRGRGLEQLIVQNFAPGGTTINTVDRLHGVLEQTPCFSLTYSNLDEAAALIRDRFATQNAPWRETAAEQKSGIVDAELSVEVPSERIGARTPRYDQMPGVILRTVGDDLFLVKEGEEGVFHLNAVAAGLWRLLEKPTTLATATDVLRAAFPNADARRVKRDVRNLFDTLQAGGLIRSSSMAQRSLSKSAGSV